MKWFKLRPDVAIVRYLEEERRRKDEESKKQASQSHEKIDSHQKFFYDIFDHTVECFEGFFKMHFDDALKDFNEKWWFLLKKIPSTGGQDLYSDLWSLWILNSKIVLAGDFYIDVFSESYLWIHARLNEKEPLKKKMLSQGAEYKSFWRKYYWKKFWWKSYYGEFLNDFKKYIKDNGYEFAKGCVYPYGQDAPLYGSSEPYERAEADIKNTEKKIKEAVNEFMKDLQQVKKGVDYDQRQTFWQWMKEWVWPVVPAFVVWLLSKCS